MADVTVKVCGTWVDDALVVTATDVGEQRLLGVSVLDMRTNYGRNLDVENSGHNDLTDKQNTVLEELHELGDAHPTVRSLADRLQTRKHRAERWTDEEVRGLLERLEAKGEVVQYEADGKQRYRPAV